jgi:hypothetical protein
MIKRVYHGDERARIGKYPKVNMKNLKINPDGSRSKTSKLVEAQGQIEYCRRMISATEKAIGLATGDLILYRKHLKDWEGRLKKLEEK